LKTLKTAIIEKSDKGNSIVIFKAEDYNNKTTNFVSEKK
jgi:hypothetical protein